jgi:hypothetical protein
VEGLVGGGTRFQAISAALGARRYHEIIVSTLPAHVSHWLHVDLPAPVRRSVCPHGRHRERNGLAQLSPPGDEARARAGSSVERSVI